MQNALPLVITGPLVLAALLAALGRLLPRWAVDALVTLTVAGVLVVGAVLVPATAHLRVVAQLGGWQPRDGVTVGVVLVADRAAAGLLLLIGVLALAAVVFSWRYFRDVDAVASALVLGFVAGMAGFVLAGDLFTMFVFFELMGVAAFALTGHRTEEPSALQGALAFGLVNSLGAYGGLLGTGMLYARTGALNLAQMGDALAGRPADALVVVAAALVTVGWLVKGALVPVHFWLADAHAAAPAPVCAMFSGVMVPLGLYGAVRVQTAVFGEALSEAFSHLLLYGGALTAVVGGVVCVQQLHLKRLLALSTVSHLGIISVGASTLTPDGLAGAGLYVVGHGLVKGALFLVSGVLLDRYGSVSELQLYGAARRERLVGALWLLGGLALAGLPPFGTWLGKSVVEEAAATEGAHWVLPLAVLTSALTGAAVLRAGARVFLGRGVRPPQDDPNEQEGRDEQRETERDVPDRVPWSMRGPVLVLMLLALVAGLWPGLRSSAVLAAHQLLGRTGYAGEVLAGRTPSTAELSHLPAATATGLLSGLAATVLAVLLAGAMLRGSTHRSRLVDLVRAPGAALRAAHTGQIGDQVAWLVAGMACVATVYRGLG